ncbi:MAG: hypothetical protein R3B95_15410 [Nitrospirales bacterium]|nr:hypothetical protein [Nitrospirales bacterium]
MAQWQKKDGPTLAPIMEPDLIEFDGTYEIKGQVAELRPNIDGRIHMTFTLEDLLLDGDVPYVRVGATALNFEIPNDSIINSQIKMTDEHTCCLGNIEFRCSDRKIIGRCQGYWRCP